LSHDNTLEFGGQRYGKNQRQIEILMETCQNNPTARVAMIFGPAGIPKVIVEAMQHITQEYPEVTFHITIIDPSAKKVDDLEGEGFRDES
jgi:hypothetical protein